jgi:hypothetical protein
MQHGEGVGEETKLPEPGSYFVEQETCDRRLRHNNDQEQGHPLRPKECLRKDAQPENDTDYCGQE